MDAEPPAGRPVPRATYRLQFSKDFGFADATAIAPYLARLGISHVYASSYLKARPGSTHGYDIVSHNELNPELGGPEDFARMVAAFRDSGLGQILDFVPNHMGVGGADNPYWLDVLEWGPQSDYAAWFDIDWRSDRSYLQDKLLVPFLGDQYGATLESGALMLRYEQEAGCFAVWAYGAHKLPVHPIHYAEILGNKHPALERIGDAFASIPRRQPQASRRADELKAELAALAEGEDEIAAAVEIAVARVNGQPGDLESWSRLDALIGRQHWRAAHFRVAADDINYRRFFNINDLAGLRMELPELFDHAHAFVFRLLGEGVLDGLRIDHIDGLMDPKAYCLRLREKAPRPLYLVVEKILAAHESLREEWDVEGTTGYEFANLVGGLLVDPAGEETLTRFYADFTGHADAFAEVVRECKLRITRNEMASELNVLARDAARVARSNPRTADFTDNLIRRALAEIIAAMPVYRTYVDGGLPTAADRRDIDWALAQARRRDRAIDPSVFDFLHALLTADLVAEPRSGFSRSAVTRVAMRAQQVSGPVMAKGLEDTAFYRYNRLLALNEVGGHPDQFSVSGAAFHHANAQRARRTPHAMLSTSTHDTKRGEDNRARLALLSELAEEWTREVPMWNRLLRAREAGSDVASPPDRNEEYAFYQLLLGVWPAELSTGTVPSADVLDAIRERIEGAMLKTLREARIHSDWGRPDEAYEAAVLAFVRYALDGARANPFLEAFSAFQRRVAELAVANSLVQAVLKLTVPGVPDLYQGSELWELSLVDPDNRRRVDFSRREAFLGGDDNLATLLAAWRDGRVKQRVTHRLLQLRASEPALFAGGVYLPLAVSGDGAGRVVAFQREHEGARLLVAVLLYPGRGGMPDADVALPENSATNWRSALNGRRVAASNGVMEAATLFSDLPVAVLVPDSAG